MLFIGVLKEPDGVDALIKIYRSIGKGVKGLHMYFMPLWLMHAVSPFNYVSQNSVVGCPPPPPPHPKKTKHGGSRAGGERTV